MKKAKKILYRGWTINVLQLLKNGRLIKTYYTVKEPRSFPDFGRMPDSETFESLKDAKWEVRYWNGVKREGDRTSKFMERHLNKLAKEHHEEA